MLKNLLLILSVALLISACSPDDSSGYEKIDPPGGGSSGNPEDSVAIDFDKIPYETLSSYGFFKGDLAELEPAERVLPYDLISTLFTDYSEKKRFVWMPEGVSATYNTDHKVLNFPDKTVLIKNFYYTNVQPGNSKRIIETRLIYKIEGSYRFANYVWNDDQSEAYFDLDGSTTQVEWVQNGETKSTDYRIPSGQECVTCHKSNEVPIPIGPKPQNLNKTYPYSTGTGNQLEKWVQNGYLQNYPSDIETVVDWKDASESLNKRTRSYLDINCAHCHTQNAHCDYRPLRLAYYETTNPDNLGICVEPDQFIQSGLNYIVSAGSYQRSMMYYRLNSTDESVRMPLMGRTLVHEEGVGLIEEWIDNLPQNCE
jgi:uncharacterized repeat protein (TIGR03806 family)